MKSLNNGSELNEVFSLCLSASKLLFLIWKLPQFIGSGSRRSIWWKRRCVLGPETKPHWNKWDVPFPEKRLHSLGRAAWKKTGFTVNAWLCSTRPSCPCEKPAFGYWSNLSLRAELMFKRLRRFLWPGRIKRWRPQGSTSEKAESQWRSCSVSGLAQSAHTGSETPMII